MSRHGEERNNSVGDSNAMVGCQSGSPAFKELEVKGCGEKISISAGENAFPHDGVEDDGVEIGVEIGFGYANSGVEQEFRSGVIGRD